VSPEDAEQQAGLVAAEDRRLTEIRSVTAVAPLKGPQWTNPYRLSTGSGYTLVLTARKEAYTVADLLKLGPETFVRQNDGSYVLAENLYVLQGATLSLSNPGGLTLRLVSNGQGFVTVVSFGGDLTLSGTAQAPMRISSWDPRTGKPDPNVVDGRAYVRAIGGQFSMTNVVASDLGFWSGRTGGISLTGTDRPNTGATESQAHLNKSQRHAAKKKRLSGPVTPNNSTLTVGEVDAAPAGPLRTPDSRFSVPVQSYVSAKITDSRISGNAYGLFVSSANGVFIDDTSIEGSLIDGLVLHRFASNAVINRTTSNRNAGNGFVLARATQQVQITAAEANNNGADGFKLTGQALAEGPSAAGQSTASYGNNSIGNSVARDNARYGIEVIGGINLGIQNNRIEGGETGIVARGSATKVAIVGNQLSNQRTQGISVRDGVTDGSITGNVISGAKTGIYLRDSVAAVRGNTVEGVTTHGVTLVGLTRGSLISFNTIAGTGPSAVDIGRSDGTVTVQRNQTTGWRDTTPFWNRLKSKASPMTLLWSAVIALVLISAVRARRHKGARGPGNRHPYEHQRPLEALAGRRVPAARGVGFAE